MNFKQTSRAWPVWLAIWFALLSFGSLAAQAKDLKFETQLIWATDADTSPDPKHKLAEEDVRKKLKEALPLKWKNYFVVKTVSFTVPEKGSREVALSDKCSIGVRDIDGRHVEVSVVGKGQPVFKQTQPLAKGQMLVPVGGNAPDSTGWLVVLKRIE